MTESILILYVVILDLQRQDQTWLCFFFSFSHGLGATPLCLVPFWTFKCIKRARKQLSPVNTAELWWITRKFQLKRQGAGGARYTRRSCLYCKLMSKNTLMFSQNCNAPVKHWDISNVVSKQTCQNTIISGLWNIFEVGCIVQL